jgi:hypothetical protein
LLSRESLSALERNDRQKVCRVEPRPDQETSKSMDVLFISNLYE